jgi:NADH-quinone oxidoreductase subunit N
MLLSLAGIPLTVGFVGKFYIFAAGVNGALISPQLDTILWILIASLIVGSGIGLFYYLRIIFAMSKRPSAEDAPAESVSIPLAGGWVMVSLTASLVALGVYPTPVIDLINSMVKSLAL